MKSRVALSQKVWPLSIRSVLPSAFAAWVTLPSKRSQHPSLSLQSQLPPSSPHLSLPLQFLLPQLATHSVWSKKLHMSADDVWSGCKRIGAAPSQMQCSSSILNATPSALVVLAILTG